MSAGDPFRLFPEPVQRLHVGVLDGNARFRGDYFHRPEPLLEAAVRPGHRDLRVDPEETGEIYQGEKEIPEFVLDLVRIAPLDGGFQLLRLFVHLGKHLAAVLPVESRPRRLLRDLRRPEKGGEGARDASGSFSRRWNGSRPKCRIPPVPGRSGRGRGSGAAGRPAPRRASRDFSGKWHPAPRTPPPGGTGGGWHGSGPCPTRIRPRSGAAP